MRKFAFFTIVAAAFCAVPAAAQTSGQQSACKADAYKFCDQFIPDQIAIEHCLRGHMGALSAACKHEFGVESGGGKHRGHHH